MKKWFSKNRSYLVRPILYKSVFRAAIALALLLLWKRCVADTGQTGLLLLRDGCLTAGILFLGFAWFSYLRFDGFLDGRNAGKSQRGQKKKKPKRGNSDIVDFADEHIIAFDELGEEERSACSLAANLVCAVGYLLAAVVGMIGKIVV